jgi:hypothetical protein
MYSNEAYVLEALRHGAAGYVLKEASGSDLVRAVREVTAGRRYLSPPLSEHAIEAYLDKAREAPNEAFNEWGWRIPFIISLLLVAVAIYIRLSLQETPIFQDIKAKGQTASNPDSSRGPPGAIRGKLTVRRRAAKTSSMVRSSCIRHNKGLCTMPLHA